METTGAPAQPVQTVPIPDPASTAAGSGQSQTSSQGKLQEFLDTSAKRKPKSKGGDTSKSTTITATTNVSGVDEEENVNVTSPDFTGPTKSLGETIAGLSVPKGLGLAFFVLIFLIWMLIPTASGYTRMQLLWFTLIGETKLANNVGGTGTTVPDSSNISLSTPAVLPTNTVEGTLAPLTSGQGPDPSQLVHNSVGITNEIDFTALDMYGI